MFIDYSNPDNVIIKHKETINKGKLYSNGKKWWLHIQTASNYYPFDIFDVDASSFIKNILGYSYLGSVIVRSKEDLIKVLDALNKEYDKHFGNKTTLKSSYFFVGGKVLVRNDLEIGKKYGVLAAIGGHISLSNRVVTICKIDYDIDTLKIEEDVYDLWWSPEMFIKLPSLPDTNMISPIVTSSKNVSFKAEESKNSTISINDFIKSKKHYQLNFNN